jgi:CDGSH-type Zn-finger protein
MSQDSFVLSLPPGTHYICSCGRSQNGPHCDGSHKGTAFNPLVLELESPQTVEISDWKPAQPQPFTSSSV